MKRNNINIVQIGKIVGKCYDFEDAWAGYNPDVDKLDIICAIHTPNASDSLYNRLRTKISVHIAKEFGTQFVNNYCNISIINYL